MIQLTVLDWLILDSTPFIREISIVEVDHASSDQIVAKKQVIVVRFDYERLCAGELHVELEHLEELGIRLIKLVIIAFVIDFIAALDDDVRV